MDWDSFNKATNIVEEMTQLNGFLNNFDSILGIEFKSGQCFLHLKVTDDLAASIEDLLRKRLETLEREFANL